MTTEYPSRRAIGEAILAGAAECAKLYGVFPDLSELQSLREENKRLVAIIDRYFMEGKKS